MTSGSFLGRSGFPSLVFLAHAVAAGSVAGCNRGRFVGEEYPMPLVSVAGRHRPIGRRAIQLPVNLHLAIAAQQAGCVTQVGFPIPPQ